MADKFFGGIRAGSESVSTVIHLTKSGAGVTGLVAADLTARYYRQGAAASAAISLSDLSNPNDAFAAGGLLEIDSTNLPGVYRLDLPNAALAASADWVEIGLVPAGTKTDPYVERIALATDVSQTGDSFARLGTPADTSVSHDLENLAAQVGTAADTDIATDIANLATTLGTPADTSVAHDLAHVYSRIGAPVRASISADIAAEEPGSESQDMMLAQLQRLYRDSGLAAFFFKMVLASDHLTGATSKTVACQVSLDGAAFGNMDTATATEVGNGYYSVPIVFADRDARVATFRFTNNDCDPTEVTIVLRG